MIERLSDGLVSRSRVARMSAWMASSSAPGTRYSSLAGMIMAAIVRRSWRSRGVMVG